jgi:molybdopterin converting factor small subunit
MEVFVQLKLFATLNQFSPPQADRYPVQSGITVGQLLDQLHVPLEQAKLIFIDGIKSDLDSPLKGGERIGVFPPVGGG